MCRINIFIPYFKVEQLFLTLVVNIIGLHLVEIPVVALGQHNDSGLCVNSSTSCTHQIASSDPQGTCFMNFFEKKECDVTPQKGAKNTLSSEFGEVQIVSYLRKEDVFHSVAFNVSFSKIKWNNLRMWFIQQPNENENYTLPSACRTFTVSSNLSLDAVIFFDCAWTNDKEAGVYSFQYEITPFYGAPTFHTSYFNFPVDTRMGLQTTIKEWQLFLLVDKSDLPKLHLKIQAVPSRFNVTGYHVTLWRSSSADGNYWPVGKSQDILATPDMSENTVITTKPYDTMNKPGLYNYTVTIIHADCDKNKNECVTIGPQILILPDRHTLVLMGLVIAVLMVPVLIAGFFIWRRSCAHKPIEDDYNRPKKILLIYNHKNSNHMDEVIGFHNFLKRNCNLDPMLDLIHIPGTESKNSTQWYKEAFEKAEFILVLACPSISHSSEPHRLNTYVNLDKISLNELQYRLALTGPRSHAVSVKWPEHNWESLPEEARNLRNFRLLRDLDPLLVYLGSAPIYDKGAALLEALKKASCHPPQPIYQTQIPSISTKLRETSCDQRTPLDNEGNELNLNCDGINAEEELNLLSNNVIGKSLNLDLSGNC